MLDVRLLLGTLEFRFSGGCHNGTTERLDLSDHNDAETLCIREGDPVTTVVWLLLSGLVSTPVHKHFERNQLQLQLLELEAKLSGPRNGPEQRHSTSNGSITGDSSCQFALSYGMEHMSSRNVRGMGPESYSRECPPRAPSAALSCTLSLCPPSANNPFLNIVGHETPQVTITSNPQD